jgi:hypothetical protein
MIAQRAEILDETEPCRASGNDEKKFLAARETFRNCAFREECCQENPGIEPESCTRCPATQLEERIRRSGPSSN